MSKFKSRKRDSGRFKPREAFYPCPYCVRDDGTPKRAYWTKAGAKRARKMTGGHWLRVYKCPFSDMWHVGHLRGEIRRGEATASEVYDRG